MSKAHYIGVSGVARNIKQPYIGVDGVARKCKNGYVGVDGVARQFLQGGLALGDIAVGSIVYLNESGSPVAFYVAKHDYESALNGSGRTLLVRNAVTGLMKWNYTDTNTYSGSYIDNYVNSTYVSQLDAKALSYISVGTTYYYTPGGGDHTKTTLKRNAFILSLKEYGGSNSLANDEGSALPISLDGRTWTRTPYLTNYDNSVIGRQTKSFRNYTATNDVMGPQPAFTLPSTALFDPSTMELL